MEKTLAQHALQSALRSLIVNDYRLLNLHAAGRAGSERAIASQLAQRLRPLFDLSWDIDVEYNRAGAGYEARVKRSDSKNGNLLLPDLIVHRRGLSGREHNIMVLELKTSIELQGESGGSLETARDIQRVFGYQYAVFLDLRLEGHGAMDPQWSWSEPTDADAGVPVRVFSAEDSLNDLLSYGRSLEAWKYEIDVLPSGG